MVDKKVKTRRIVDELVMMAVNTLPAIVFLIVYGQVIFSRNLAGLWLLLVFGAFLVDMVSEVWLFLNPLSYNSAELDRVIYGHYAVTAAGYLVLLAGILDVVEIFAAYSVFLLLWLIGFIAGEVVVLFMDDRFEDVKVIDEV